jgi:hypothetical protein
MEGNVEAGARNSVWGSVGLGIESGTVPLTTVKQFVAPGGGGCL